MTLRLGFCTHAAAVHAVKRWHYSRSMPTPPVVKIGVWESERFIGCVLFSRGNAPFLAQSFSVEQTQIAELSRVALTTHAAPVSKIVSIALKLLRKRCPGLRLLVSFADPAQGHVGGIYQALGWAYLGKTAPTTLYRDKTGRVWHSRQISVTGRKKQYGEYRSVPSTLDCVPIEMPSKHRYAFGLDDDMRRRLALLKRAYPKRAAESDSRGLQPAEAGLTPSPPLQP